MKSVKWSFSLLLVFYLIFQIQPEGQVEIAKASETQNIYIPSIYRPVENTCANKIPFQPASDAAMEAETLRQINARRAANGGLSQLAMNDALVQIGRFHSKDMGVNNIASHDGSAGENAWARYEWLCEKYDWKGEIIAWGFGGDIGTVIEWWMNSPGHHDIILKPEFTDAGAGYYRGGTYGHYWTVDFGRKSSASSALSGFPSRATCTTEVQTSDEGGISITTCE